MKNNNNNTKTVQIPELKVFISGWAACLSGCCGRCFKCQRLGVGHKRQLAIRGETKPSRAKEIKLALDYSD